MAPSEQLPFIVKRDIVQRLADFQGLTEVAKAIKDTYGLDLKPQKVQYYDPTKAAGRALAQDLKTLFFETRAKSLTDIEGIRISHKAHQLRALDRQLAKAENSPGPNPLVIALVEAAAKIAGTVAASKVDVNHSGSVKAVSDIVPVDLSSLTNEQLTQLYREAAASSQGTGPERKPTAH